MYVWPGPTSNVFFGQPSKGFLVGCWHALRLTVDRAEHASRRHASAKLRRIVQDSLRFIDEPGDALTKCRVDQSLGTASYIA